MTAQLSLDFDAARATLTELVDELSDTTMILDMGEHGIAEHVAAGLRARRLAAARELVRRWESAP